MREFRGEDIMNKRILIIEDEKAIRNVLKTYLEKEGYQIDLANDGLVGMEKFQKNTYDLILLDVMMPTINGYLLLEMIRQTSNVPVIMITALENEENQIKAFDLKVDDYITKPFSIKLVLRRIMAVLRREEAGKESVIASDDILRYQTLTLNTKLIEVSISDKPVTLTKKEFDLLKLLLQNPQQVFTRDMLLEQVWGYGFHSSTKIVNAHIQNLRKKLGGNYIEAVRGVGYRLSKQNEK